MSNEKNHQAWPQVVSKDVQRHVYSLKSNVYVVSGQVKGKTLLPLPVGSEKVDEGRTLEVEEEEDAEEIKYVLHDPTAVGMSWMS